MVTYIFLLKKIKVLISFLDLFSLTKKIWIQINREIMNWNLLIVKFFQVSKAIFPKVTDKIAEYSENNVFDKTKSQTSKPVVYPFTHKEDNSQFHVIDTPGFGDTDRTKDETNLQSIFKEASQHPFISAIVLIINGTLSRETTSLKFVLESIILN
jgi:hypothetical protein